MAAAELGILEVYGVWLLLHWFTRFQNYCWKGDDIESCEEKPDEH